MGCPRNALEQTTIGTCCQVYGEAIHFAQSRAAQPNVAFGRARTRLAGVPSLQALNAHLQATLNDSILDQTTQGHQGRDGRVGYAPSQATTHTRPGFRNVGMLASNGPQCVPDAFVPLGQVCLQACALGFLPLMLGRPGFQLPQDALFVFGSAKVRPTKIVRLAYEYLLSNGSPKR
jgi:hypothetical protein